MPSLVARRFLLLAVVPLIVLLGSVGAAAANKVKKVTSCDARAGKTLLEDATTRVYEFNGLEYACARPTGRASLLFRRDGPGKGPISASAIELAGGYVAWSENDSISQTETIVVLDVARRTYRTANSDALNGMNYHIGEFLLSSKGTVVLLEEFSACAGAGCSAQSTVIASSAHGTSTLAKVSNDSTGPAPQATLPITSLGLSQDGNFAFWVDDGKYEGAKIPWAGLR